MPTHYSVVQYVPDPLAGERINIGMLAVDDQGVTSMRFLDSWSRVESFAAGRDISFLRDFVEEMEEGNAEQPLLGGLPDAGTLTAERLAAMSGRWRNAIQFTPPAASLWTPEHVVAKLAPRMLTLAQPQPRARPRTRRTARATAIHAASMAVSYHEVGARVRTMEWVKGGVESYQFDAVVLDGRPILALQGLSLESTRGAAADQAIDALAFGIIDILRVEPQMRFGLVLLRDGPDDAVDQYRRAIRQFNALSADVLDENDAQGWAISILRDYRDGKLADPPPPSLGLQPSVRVA